MSWPRSRKLRPAVSAKPIIFLKRSNSKSSVIKMSASPLFRQMHGKYSQNQHSQDDGNISKRVSEEVSMMSRSMSLNNLDDDTVAAHRRSK
ncbi:hypothetical protein JTE90_023798 [Oedothorax gibbosus]|uniref:Uncharacterized protein n=1 Tax=Oedothorax gibbosus TaxID=931172 RepID=A0AAV6VL04_9ARAC|nr:hypothetical protein JTE90_023798 [Oedothorax gibbosus]